MTDVPKLIEDLRAGLEGVTPGEWRVGPVDDTIVTAADGSEVAQIDGDYNEPDLWPIMEANAAHIARCSPDNIRAVANGYIAQAERIAALEAENKALREALNTAALWFEEYATGHREKGDDAKAARDEGRAKYCRTALGAP